MHKEKFYMFTKNDLSPQHAGEGWQARSELVIRNSNY